MHKHIPIMKSSKKTRNLKLKIVLKL